MKIPRKISLGFPLCFFYEVRDMGDKIEKIYGKFSYSVVLQIKPKLITKILEKLLKVREKNELL